MVYDLWSAIQSCYLLLYGLASFATRIRGGRKHKEVRKLEVGPGYLGHLVPNRMCYPLRHQADSSAAQDYGWIITQIKYTKRVTQHTIVSWVHCAEIQLTRIRYLFCLSISFYSTCIIKIKTVLLDSYRIDMPRKHLLKTRIFKPRIWITASIYFICVRWVMIVRHLHSSPSIS